MTRLLTALLLFLAAFPALATPPDPLLYNDTGFSSFWYGREFDIPVGASGGYLVPAYGPDTHAIPGGYLRSVTISSSIKVEGVEVLAGLVCSGKAIWFAEHNKKETISVVITLPPLPVTTPVCFMWVKTINTTGSVKPRAYEMQVTGIVTPTP